MCAADLLLMNALSCVRAGTGSTPTLYATNHVLLLTRFLLLEKVVEHGNAFLCAQPSDRDKQEIVQQNLYTVMPV